MSRIKDGLRHCYLREGIYPCRLSLFIIPFYFTRKGLASHDGKLAYNIKETSLDADRGSRPYQVISSASEYIARECVNARTVLANRGRMRSITTKTHFKGINADKVNPKELQGE